MKSIVNGGGVDIKWNGPEECWGRLSRTKSKQNSIELI